MAESKLGNRSLAFCTPTRPTHSTARTALRTILANGKKRHALFWGAEVPVRGIYYQIYMEKGRVYLLAEGYPTFRLDTNDWGIILDEIWTI